MLYLEINTHTAQRRLHDDASLVMALKRDLQATKNLTKIPAMPYEGAHSYFREATATDMASHIRRANPDGSWGLDELRVKCSACNGSGHVEIKPEQGKAYTLPCYNCNHTGYLRAGAAHA
jgi:excinuclease UvrABC ATPase subunit